jgi:hypothetical protein
MRRSLPTAFSALAAAAAMVLGGCLLTPGGADGGTGGVRVLITDKPFPFEFLSEATVTITEVELRRAGDDDDGNDNDSDDTDGNDNDVDDDQNDNDVDDDNSNANDDGGSPFVTIFEGEREFNLLDLRNGRTDLLTDADVPAGAYTQMRLIVTGGRVVLTDGREFDLDVPSGDTSGIKLHFTFTVEDDAETTLLLDVDLSRAFRAVPAGHIDDVATIREFSFHPSLAMRLVDLLEAGEIQGTVTDEAAVPLAGVAVTAFNAEGDEVSTTATDADGTYALVGLPPGTYRLEFSLAGYADATVTDDAVQAGQASAGVDVVLTAAAQ